jgi:hypothetical protein
MGILNIYIHLQITASVSWVEKRTRSNKRMITEQDIDCVKTTAGLVRLVPRYGVVYGKN